MNTTARQPVLERNATIRIREGDIYKYTTSSTICPHPNFLIVTATTNTGVIVRPLIPVRYKNRIYPVTPLTRQAHEVGQPHHYERHVDENGPYILIHDPMSDSLEKAYLQTAEQVTRGYAQR